MLWAPGQLVFCIPMHVCLVMVFPCNVANGVPEKKATVLRKGKKERAKMKNNEKPSRVFLQYRRAKRSEGDNIALWTQRQSKGLESQTRYNGLDQPSEKSCFLLKIAQVT